jgi:hypothetical protein
MWGEDKQVVCDMCRLIVEWMKKRQGVVKKAKKQVVAWEGFILWKMDVDYNAFENEWAIAHKVKLDKGIMKTSNNLHLHWYKWTFEY